MARKSTWTNADGLVVGFGPNTPEVGGNDTIESGIKTAAVQFTWKQTGVNVPVPAGTQVIGVALEVIDAWTGGTAITVGDGNSATGFIDATQGATANLTAGKKLIANGAYTKGGTDTTAQEFKLYSSADTVDIAYSGTFTGGSARLVVTYL